MEINDRDRILRPGIVVVDLGAAPGGWSQVAQDKVGSQGTVVALDILSMEPLPGVHFIQGDCRDPLTLAKLKRVLGDQHPQLVLSDMAPNISGVRATDEARARELADQALDFACDVLPPGGSLLVKLFQGCEVDDFRRVLREKFARLDSRKPAASRAQSKELYLLGRGYGV